MMRIGFARIEGYMSRFIEVELVIKFGCSRNREYSTSPDLVVSLWLEADKMKDEAQTKIKADTRKF